MAITAAELMVRVGADTAEADRKLDGFDSKLRGMAGGMRKAGLRMSAAITAPVAGIATAALMSAAGFEQSFNMLAVVSGATEGQLASLQQQALDLGRDTSFSAGEAADAMLELAKAGMSTEQVADSISGVLDLAAAGGLGLAKSAEIASNAMNAFGLDAKETTRVADILAAAANASSVDVTDLAQSFKMSSSVFASSGQTIEDMSTALAILGNYSLKGSDAGTSLKTMMMRLTAPTDQAADAMAELGLRVFDADGAMRPFKAIISDLETAVSGLTDEQRSAALATIFGADAVRAANILIAEGAAGWDAMSEAVNTSGAASEAADARMSGLAGAIEYFKGSIDSMLAAEGIPFLDFLSSAVRNIADLITSFGNLPAGVQTTAIVFLGLAAAAGPALLLLSGLTSVLTLILSPVGLVIAAVVALAAAFATDFMGIRTSVMSVVNAVRPHFEQLLSWISSAASGDWGPLKAGLQGALSAVKAEIDAFSWSDFVTSLGDWGTYIDALVWKTFVPQLTTWGAYVAKLGWGDYISSLEWKTIIPKMADWGMWVALLPWNQFVTAIDLTTYAVSLIWKNFVDKLNWSDNVSSLSDWADYISDLDWSGFITSLSDWSAYIGGVTWSAFIANVKWPAFVTSINWGDFVTDTLDNWSSYISTLEWVSYITATLDDWSNYVSNLTWTDVVTALADWGTWIVLLPWNTFVKAIDLATYVAILPWGDYVTAIGEWATYITSLQWSDFVTSPSEWGTYISSLSWNDFVNSVGEWSDYITSLPWGDYITAITDWGTWIGGIVWSEFIDNITWPVALSLFDWSTFVPDVTWPNVSFEWSTFVPDVTWPDLSFDWSVFVPKLKWPTSTTTFSWSTFVPKVRWPWDKISNFDWSMFVPRLSWPGVGRKGATEAAVNASGSNVFPGGLTWVGERGPELVSLPGASRIYDNQDSMAMAGGGNVTVYATVNNDIDIERLAYRIRQELRRG